MKEIKLTQGKVALVDDNEFERINQFKWCAHKRAWENKWYAVRNPGTVNNRKFILLHRFIMNAPPELEVDHIDGDGLNNCLSNLRLATKSQNAINREKYNPSGYRGVTWRKDSRWGMGIKINGSRIRKCGFSTAEEAAKYYDELAIKHHREFARLNFPK